MYLVAPPSNLEACIQCVLDNYLRLCHDVSEEEVSRAKTQLKASLLNQTDSFSLTCEDIGRQMLAYGRRMPSAEVFARINAITRDDILATANAIVNDEDHALAAVGPIQGLPDYKWIRERTVWK